MSIVFFCQSCRKPSKPHPLDDAEDSKPYALAKPLHQKFGRVKVQDNIIVSQRLKQRFFTRAPGVVSAFRYPIRDGLLRVGSGQR